MLKLSSMDKVNLTKLMKHAYSKQIFSDSCHTRHLVLVRWAKQHKYNLGNHVWVYIPPWHVVVAWCISALAMWCSTYSNISIGVILGHCKCDLCWSVPRWQYVKCNVKTDVNFTNQRVVVLLQHLKWLIKKMFFLFTLGSASCILHPIRVHEWCWTTLSSVRDWASFHGNISVDAHPALWWSSTKSYDR